MGIREREGKGNHSEEGRGGSTMNDCNDDFGGSVQMIFAFLCPSK